MSAVVPRLSIAGCSAVRWVGMVVLCCTGLCGVVLWMLMTMVPCTEVLMSEGDYGAQDLQVVAVVVRIPVSFSNEQEFRLVFSFL